MEEFDIDELLECDDIEQTAFMSSSKQLLSVIDNVINCIDDRINAKKGHYYGNYVTSGIGYQAEEYGPVSHFTNNLYGYHNKHQSNLTHSRGGA